MLPPDPYKLDDTFVTKGWVMIAEGKKGDKTRQWGDNSHDTYVKIDPEAQRRTLEFIERSAKSGKPFYIANWPNLGLQFQHRRHQAARHLHTTRRQDQGRRH